jgi:hypothetical protein
MDGSMTASIKISGALRGCGKAVEMDFIVRRLASGVTAAATSEAKPFDQLTVCDRSQGICKMEAGLSVPQVFGRDTYTSVSRD